MLPERATASVLAQWAEPVPDMGRAVYRLTHGPKEHKHTYHLFCPWSPDGRLLLLLRYDRVDADAEVCVLDTATRDVRAVGCTANWNSHGAAFQQWQGDRDRILYLSVEDGEPAVVTVRPDGSDEHVFPTGDLTPHARMCSPDGRWGYSATRLEVMFPNDEIAARHDKGLWRIDLETGARELVLSIDRAVALLPNPEDVEAFHLYAKMIVHHRRRERILFNLTNTFWDRDGKEPRTRCIVSLDADGSNPAYVGRLLHHPNWHPIEDRILANVLDFNDQVRFGLYRADREGLLEYVPNTAGSGHPSFSPDGRWLCTDGAGPGRCSRVGLYDPQTGHETVAAEYEAFSEGYASFRAVDNRAAGETVTNALVRARESDGRTWQTQAHPAWSRDGNAILFNADLGDGSQLYVVDVERTLSES